MNAGPDPQSSHPNRIMQRRFEMNIKLLFLGIVAIGLCLPNFSFAQTYDPYLDFSTSANPNGTWSYGKTSSLGGSFSLLTQSLTFDAGKLEGWGWREGGSGGADPFIIANLTGVDVASGTTVYAAETLAMHPSFNQEYAVLRWTAPSSGDFSIDVSFFDVSDTFGV